MLDLNKYNWGNVNIIKRYKGNPILSAKDIPYRSDLVYNAGVVKFNGKYIMLFRNDYFNKKDNEFYNYNWWAGTDLGFAISDDGIQFTPLSKPFIKSSDFNGTEILRYYDPRLIVIDKELYFCFAIDTKHGVCGGIGKISENLDSMTILSISAPDNRNFVLFPKKIDGKYVRLERPLPVYSRGGEKFDIWMSKSYDMKYWGETELVLGATEVPFSNSKIGPAAQPVETESGWLTTFHSVYIDETLGNNGWEKIWQKIYCAGIMLLDLNNPAKVIGLCKRPLIAPEFGYETEGGIRNNVIFPGGMILEENGEVKIYYGAADTVECLATANVHDLISLCKNTK